MKLTLKERKQVKEYAKKLIEGRLSEETLLDDIKSKVSSFKKLLMKKGYSFDTTRRYIK